MSTLETNSIGKYNGNNVSVDDSLRFKNYTTTERNALTSVAGDTIYNTTTSKIEFYNGSSWVEAGGTDISTFTVEFLVIGAGGGGGGGEPHTAGDQAGGGGAGRYRTSYGSGNISGGLSAVESDLTINKGVPIPVSIGAGGSGGSGSGNKGGNGNDVYFYNIFSLGGGGGGTEEGYDDVSGRDGGSGGGNGKRNGVHGATAQALQVGQPFYTGYGFRGGYASGGNRGGSGGGGAGAVGTEGGQNFARPGGAGIDSSITGSAVGRGGGGGGGAAGGNNVVASSDGGGNGGSNNTVATAGTANTGGGGGGGSCQTIGQASVGAAGGSGVVIIRYATSDVSSYSQTGLTISSSTDGSDTILEITAGTGSVTFT